MMRADLNDYAYFVEVVAHGGFAPAGRALREPKSKLSRRIAGLEARLGVRLIERSSRRFRVTEVGQSFYERCRAMLDEAQQAEAVVAQAQSEPHGRVRFSCPTGLVEVISPILTQFLARYPKVRLQLVATDRGVDLIEERIDLALRVRVALTSDAALTMRSLGQSSRILVGSPQMATRIGGDIAALASHPTLGTSDEMGEITWHLEQEDGTAHQHRHEPRMSCGDFAAVRAAAIADLGVALLPDHICAEALRSGQLVHILPDWQAQRGIVHLVFTTRRGLPRRAGADRPTGGRLPKSTHAWAR
jgi:DNA-binding transcriptional LysR family regulator